MFIYGPETLPELSRNSDPRHKSWNTCVIFPSPTLIWVCSHFSAPKYARLNIGEGERHIWVRTKVWSVNVRNLEKIQDKGLLFQRLVTSIEASEENDGAVNGIWMRMNLLPAAILQTLLLFLKLLQNVIIKLADFGFAKIDRGDLVTPQFTPYYVSPQVKIK